MSGHNGLCFRLQARCLSLSCIDDYLLCLDCCFIEMLSSCDCLHHVVDGIEVIPIRLHGSALLAKIHGTRHRGWKLQLGSSVGDYVGSFPFYGLGFMVQGLGFKVRQGLHQGITCATILMGQSLERYRICTQL